MTKEQKIKHEIYNRFLKNNTYIEKMTNRKIIIDRITDKHVIGVIDNDYTIHANYKNALEYGLPE